MKIYDIAARPDDSFPFAAEGGEMNGLFPEHTHTYTELMVITGGRGWHVSANGRHWLTPGTVITVPPPLAHQMEEMEHLQLYVLKFDLPRLMAYDYDLKNDPGFRSLFVHCPFPQQPGSQAKPLQLDQEQLRHVTGLMSVMLREFSDRKSGYKVIIRTHLLALTAYLSRCFLPERNLFSLQMEKLLPSITFMEENLHRPIRMKELADTAFLSTRQYDRIFKEVYGVCPSEYLSQLRLNRACELMASRQCPLNQIWEKCGFTDNPFFYKKFKSRFGLTPRQYQIQLLASICD